MRRRIIIIDDEFQVRQLVKFVLEKFGHEILEFASPNSLPLDGVPPDLVLLDLKFPDADGLSLLPELKQRWPGAAFLVLTGQGSVELAVEAIKRGAFDFQTKPFDVATLQFQVERALEHKDLLEEQRNLRRALSTLSGGTMTIVQSGSLRSIVRLVERIAPSDVSVLITGESGSGKEVIADMLHALSPRQSGPFVKINCAALPHELIESELFGFSKGAFTGATGDRSGLFRQAEGGTLLLDELAEMPVGTQSKLLRVLQDKEVRPVGSHTSYKIDCRVIAATNRPPEEAIRSGKLREDLFYRISAVSIHVPPLRERKEDILPLATAFLKQFAAQANRVVTGFTGPAQQALRGFPWPGNVRQLQNEVQQAVLMCHQSTLDVSDLTIGPAPADESHAGNLNLLQANERDAIREMLKETSGNKLETSRRLGIGRQTLYNKLELYGISMPIRKENAQQPL